MNADTWVAIMDDNPSAFSNRINGTYPKGKSLSTVPPNSSHDSQGCLATSSIAFWDAISSCTTRGQM